ncbi:ISAs1 family transposase [Phormidium sp. CLA17]|nr:ISAs1 family transposase [Leptolyngbya sp. Cla-17]
MKANQKTLYQQLQDLAQRDTVFSIHLDAEQTRDRQTTRIAAVFPLPDSLKHLWSGAQQGVEVIRLGKRQGEPYYERRYYITSWSQQADALQARIRSHWGIENPLHWVKDVVLGEDQSSIAAKPAATLMAFIRNLVIIRNCGRQYFLTRLNCLNPIKAHFALNYHRMLHQPLAPLD